MKLSECLMGILVQDMTDLKRVGHVVGLKHNCSLSSTLRANLDESGEIIPVVKFVGQELAVGIHHANIQIFKD